MILYGKLHLIYLFISALLAIVFTLFLEYGSLIIVVDNIESTMKFVQSIALISYVLFAFLLFDSGMKISEEYYAFKKLNIKEKYYYYVRNNKYKKIQEIIKNKNFIFPQSTFYIEKQVAKNNIKFLNIILNSADFDPTLNDNIIFEKSTPQIRKILWKIPKVKKTLKLTRPKIYKEIISDKINLF